ncbi:copper radical oxidase [Rhizoctonia solani AG-1 IA]|uniref:Copper radical oxidase n=1 Tax=Thanatephorus cucumeris (strain AG1-IA) TaxID=983506 RepID=L8WIQ9_THACA|nr:copper radical oxidase [Rhizoctonia solani AG-1 IA]
MKLAIRHVRLPLHVAQLPLISSGLKAMAALRPRTLTSPFLPLFSFSFSLLVSVDSFLLPEDIHFVPSHSLELNPSININNGLVHFYSSRVYSMPLRIGTWGVDAESARGAMQIAVVSSDTVLIIDKIENNPLKDAEGKPAWASVYSLKSHTARPLKLVTNSFCAGGGWLSNVVNIGGNPVVESGGGKAENGLQGVRLYNPCAENENCEIFESPNVSRLSDGSLLIIGGAYGGGWTNFKELNNPTYEFYPPKNINGFNVQLTDLIVMLDWQRNVETRLPDLPNGQRITYPMSGAGVMLPLRWDKAFAAEILMCGGSDTDDRVKDTDLSAKTTPGSSQCSRMVLNNRGIKKGWQVEKLPTPWMMPEGVLLPTGQVLIINGASTGTAGYANLKDQVGVSNADNPVFQPVLYDPDAPAGKRFSREGLPTSNIPRMYHSVATLLPSGAIFVAGSNPNEDVTERTYGTEYRTEILYPDYMSKPRPVITRVPDNIEYNRFNRVIFSMPGAKRSHRRGIFDFFFKKVEVVLMDFGFATHGVHMDQRLVSLATFTYGKRHLQFQGPPNPNVYPPGPAWLFVIVDGVPSEAVKVMVGEGRSPPVDLGAIENMLANTGNPVPIEALHNNLPGRLPFIHTDLILDTINELHIGHFYDLLPSTLVVFYGHLDGHFYFEYSIAT